MAFLSYLLSIKVAEIEQNSVYLEYWSFRHMHGVLTSLVTATVI